MEIAGDSRRAQGPGARVAEGPRARAAAVLLAALAAASAEPAGAAQGQPAPDRADPAVGAPPPADTARGARLPGRAWEARLREGAALASLLTLDRPVRLAARELRADAPEGGALDRIAERAEWFGDWEASLPWLVGGSLAVGHLTGGSRGLRRGAALLAGGAAASMANEALNRAVGRARPSWGEGALSLEPFRGHAAFPSGHTAYVFGVASGIDVVTEGWIPAAAAYGVAGLTGLSRIYHDRHWLTDVAAGAAVSTVISRLATRTALEVLGAEGDRGSGEGRARGGGPGRWTTPRLPTRRPGPRLEPLVSPRAVGVTVRF